MAHTTDWIAVADTLLREGCKKAHKLMMSTTEPVFMYFSRGTKTESGKFQPFIGYANPDSDTWELMSPVPMWRALTVDQSFHRFRHIAHQCPILPYDYDPLDQP
jgi:hypothetical protein